MPTLTARERPLLAFGFLIGIALLALMSLVPAVGGAPVHAEGESLPPFSPPEESQPQQQCSAADSAGELPPGSQTISGTVTDEAAAVGPLGGIQVRFSASPDGQTAASVITEADGSYSLGDLGDGSYFVSFFDSSSTYQSGFHAASGLALTPGDAEVVVLDGSGAVVDAALPYEQTRNLSGTVMDSDSLPVAGVLLTARSTYFPMVACDSTDSSGFYVIPGLSTMAFRLAVTDPSGLHPNGFYSDVAPGHFTISFAAATQLTAGASDMTGVDIQFPAVHTLSGIVRDEALNPVSGISVTACVTENECVGSATSDQDGAFSMDGLVAGDYVLRLNGANAGYLDGWYDGQGAFTRVEAEAEPVTVSDDVSNLDVLVVAAPLVSGTVRDEQGQPLGEISVSFSDDVNGLGGGGSTDGGAYGVALQPGTYILRVDDQRYPPVYPSGYLGAGESFVLDPATAFQIVVGEDDVSGVDVTIPDGGSIDFSVVMGGTPVPYAFVDICSAEAFCPLSAQADDNGQATISAILPGPYYVRVTADFEHFYWYVSETGVSEDFGAATTVVVTANATQSITLALPSPGTPTPACEGAECEPIPLDDGTGASPVELTFENVVEGGTTTLTIPSEEPVTPAGFKFGDPPTYYEITTTAVLADGTGYTICVTFDPSAFEDPDAVRLFHFVAEPSPGAWENITDTGYPANGTVCGTADSLSPFALVEPAYSFAGFFGAKSPPQVNEAKAGDTVGIQFSLGADIGLAIFAAGSPTVERVDCATHATIGTPALAATGSPALKYNAKTGRYTFQWKTNKAWKNTCQRLVLTFKDGSSAEVLFHFKK